MYNPDSAIEAIQARESLDSRGRPTVEAQVQLTSGAMGLYMAFSSE
jgi:enolase